MNVHVSLLDKKGRNIFQGKDPTGSPELRCAVQGLRLTLSESMLICAHHASSYHRFENFSYAPINSSWFYNNRTVSFRTPANDVPDMWIEHLLTGADANLSLLVAALLAGIHHGLSVKKKHPPPVEGNAYLISDTELPRTWEQARNSFEQAEILPEYFSRDFSRLFTNLKSSEKSRFLSRIVAHEYDWYLKSV